MSQLGQTPGSGSPREQSDTLGYRSLQKAGSPHCPSCFLRGKFMTAWMGFVRLQFV